MPPGKKHGWLFWLGIALLIVFIGSIATLEILLHRAEPILRARVLQTLSARFDSRVELKKFSVSLFRGFEVSGQGLEIYPYNLKTNHPTFSIDKFSFRTAYTNLLRTPMTIGHVDVQGMRINLPPKSQRKQLTNLSKGPGGDSKMIKMFVNEIRATNVLLTLETDKPGKVPLQFDIQRLDLKSVGAGRPMDFQATLTNPKPVGNIQSTGYFGPWNADDPGATVLGGSYSFTNALLGTFKGIEGTLSSKGKYQGTLDNIVVQGETDTPDFEVDISGHKVPLQTEFHAIVDGTNGDTYLQPVIATFLRSSLTAAGYVVHAVGEPGKHIYLDVTTNHAHIQDLLQLAVRTEPPLMTGRVKLHTKLEIPPGQEDIVKKLKLNGKFEILNAHFTNPQIQSKVDELSLRGQGQPGLAKKEAKDPNTADVMSHMQGDFQLSNSLLTVSNLNYDVPGAHIKLDGTYSLDGDKFDFAGVMDLKASLSKVVGGWKGLLLKPAEPFFKKNGAGTEVPIKITGTKSEPHFGLDLRRKDKPQNNTPQK